MAVITPQAYPVPTIPVPVDKVPLPYTPHRFSVCPAPLPMVVDPLPDVLRQYEQDATKNLMKQKEAERRAKPKKAGLIGGVFNALEEVGGQLQKGIHEVYTEFDRGIRSTNFENAQKNFYHFFRMPSEPLWREYLCHAVNGDQDVYGNMYISDHYVGFCGEKRLEVAHKQQRMHRLVFVVPFHNILSIQLGVTGKPTRHDGAPPIHVNTNPHVKTDAVVLYSIDGSIHQFYGFWNQPATFNVLDHAWRAAWQDPSPQPFPYPIGQDMPPFMPIARKDRPGLGQSKQPLQPPLWQQQSTTITYATIVPQPVVQTQVYQHTPGTAMPPQVMSPQTQSYQQHPMQSQPTQYQQPMSPQPTHHQQPMSSQPMPSQPMHHQQLHSQSGVAPPVYQTPSYPPTQHGEQQDQGPTYQGYQIPTSGYPPGFVPSQHQQGQHQQNQQAQYQQQPQQHQPQQYQQQPQQYQQQQPQQQNQH